MTWKARELVLDRMAKKTREDKDAKRQIYKYARLLNTNRKH